MNKKRKQGTKGQYQRTLADPDIAKAMDILSDEYRIKIKFFPVIVISVYQKKESENMTFASLKQMAEKLYKEDWFGKDGSYIKRLDESGNLIKKHVHRNILK